MPSLAYDLAFLKIGTPDLKSYLLSKEIYWPVGGRAPKGEGRFPRMTLGWILLSAKRAGARVETASDRAALSDFENLINIERNRWRTAWENKAAREFESRLKLWGRYLGDVRKASGDNTDRFGYEVNRRVLLNLLKNETTGIGKESLELLAAQDKFLRGKLRSGSFLWEPELESAFPQGEYWYLYGSLTP